MRRHRRASVAKQVSHVGKVSLALAGIINLNIGW
jgi:hypothetical protein